MPKHCSTGSNAMIPQPRYVPYEVPRSSGGSKATVSSKAPLSVSRSTYDQQSPPHPHPPSAALELHPIIPSLPARSRRLALLDTPCPRRGRIASQHWAVRPDGSVLRAIRRIIERIKGKSAPLSNLEQGGAPIRRETSLRPNIHDRSSTENRSECARGAKANTTDTRAAPSPRHCASSIISTSKVAQWIRFTRGPFRGDVARVIDRIPPNFTWAYVVPRLSPNDHATLSNTPPAHGLVNLKLDWGGERKLLPYALAADAFGRARMARASDYFMLGGWHFTMDGFLIMEASARDFEDVYPNLTVIVNYASKHHMSNLHNTTTAAPGSSSSTTLSNAIGDGVHPPKRQTARKSTGARPPRPILQSPKAAISKSPKVPRPPVKPKIGPPPPLPPSPQQNLNPSRTSTWMPVEEDDAMEVMEWPDFESEDMEDELAESGAGGAPLGTGQTCQRCLERSVECTFLTAKRLPSSCDQCRVVNFKCSLRRKIIRKSKPDSSGAAPVQSGSGERPMSARAAREPEVPPPQAAATTSVHDMPMPQTPITAGLEPFIEAFLGRVEDRVRKTVREELEGWKAEQKKT
ncbi:hypothetical protein CONPUDRAFT_165398 [Coniophora puteana RWD-64-598 SS2]|uniref:Uncharacterized protein n=1 Tax=Coniophora puteana (strain RWD-64-598) TaxID=741705 RepID=A0A5M3MRA0_CONPW|nr:uncharacterized protein CONPUDRAFT_165398 [Coniophora puteana RWD-64-598 SS2]EIW81185.1 hypothetical protein CONPUDRAFT_165398 [Coniophora puteana RWD-64-598 SS2]